MKEELRAVNALVGMSVGVPSWPSLLKDEGFALVALEPEVSVRVNANLRVNVKPEAVFFSELRNQSLLLESKSATLNIRQAQGYHATSAADLQAVGALPADVDALGHRVVPLYIAAFGHEGDLATAIATFNHDHEADLPLVVYSNHRMWLAAGIIRNTYLHGAFDGHVSIDEGHWPSSLVPFDATSPKYDVAGPVISELVMMLVNEEITSFCAEDLAQGHPLGGGMGCVAFYAKLGAAKKSQFRLLIAEIVEEIRASYMSAYLTRTGPAEWRVDKHITGRGIATAGKNLQEYRDLIREGRALPARSRARDVPGQLDVADVDVPPDSLDPA